MSRTVTVTPLLRKGLSVTYSHNPSVTSVTRGGTSGRSAHQANQTNASITSNTVTRSQQTVTPSAQDQRTSTPAHVRLKTSTYGTTVTPLSRPEHPIKQRRANGHSWWIGADRAKLSTRLGALAAKRRRADLALIDAYISAHPIERHVARYPASGGSGGSNFWGQR